MIIVCLVCIGSLLFIYSWNYIYIPSIKLEKNKIYPITYLIKNNKKPKIENSSYFFDTDILKVTATIEIYNGVSNNLISRINESYLIPLNIDSNFELIELFTKNDLEYVNSEIANIANDLSNIIVYLS